MTSPDTVSLAKRAESRNSTTHALHSRRFIVEPDQQASFDNLQTTLRAEILSLGALEIDAFQQLLAPPPRTRKPYEFDPLKRTHFAPPTRLYDFVETQAAFGALSLLPRRALLRIWQQPNKHAAPPSPPTPQS